MPLAAAPAAPTRVLPARERKAAVSFEAGPAPSPRVAHLLARRASQEALAAAASVPSATTAPDVSISKMTVPTLRAELAARGLDSTGLKAVLQARLLEACGPSLVQPSPPHPSPPLPPLAAPAAAPTPTPPAASPLQPPPAVRTPARGCRCGAFSSRTLALWCRCRVFLLGLRVADARVPVSNLLC